MTASLFDTMPADTAARFEQFHAENPIVYPTLVGLAREWVAEHGKSKLGIRMLWEVARWELIRATRNVDYKLNDHFTSYYARLIQRMEPDLEGVFELRSSPADRWINNYEPNGVTR